MEWFTNLEVGVTEGVTALVALAGGLVTDFKNMSMEKKIITVGVGVVGLIVIYVLLKAVVN